MDDLPTRSVFGVRCEEEGIVTGIPDMQYLVLHRDQGKLFLEPLFFLEAKDQSHPFHGPRRVCPHGRRPHAWQT